MQEMPSGLTDAVGQIEAWAAGQSVDQALARSGASAVALLIKRVAPHADLLNARMLLELLGDGKRFRLDESTAASALRMAASIRVHLGPAQTGDAEAKRG